jgi:hypothetical protein
VYETQGAVAGIGVVDDDAKAVHIDHLVERDALVLHLLVDAVQVLLAALHAARDRGLLQGALEGLGDLADELLLVAARTLQFAFEHLVAIRVERPESEILELQFDGVQAETLGDRCVDLQSFARAAPPLDRRHDAQGAHVVHAVRELDHDDADIPHHREQHLAKALRLGFLAVLELNLIEFAHPVDELGDDLAEDGGDFGLRGRRVLDHVVQDGRDQRIGVQPQIRQNVRNGDRMRDVRLARNPLLAVMPFCAELIGFPHALDLSG